MESLESRLALSAAPVSPSVSLADYLALTPAMGPLEPSVAVEVAPAIDSAAIQAADALAAALSAESLPEDAAEGEGSELTMLTFHVGQVDGGFLRLWGTISLGTSSMVFVRFGGIVPDEIVMANSAGDFEHYLPNPGLSGLVSARASDDMGAVSNSLSQLYTYHDPGGA
jgi:hypothetical protein